MNLTTQTKWLVAAAILVTFSTILSACSTGGDSENQQSGSDLVDTGQSSPSGSASTSTPVRPESTTIEENEIDPEATPQPGAPANVRVPTDEVTVDSLTLTLSVQPARRMVTSNTSPSAATPQPQQGQNSEGAAAQQELVLGVQTQQISKNLDSSQSPPPDPKDEQGDYIRNVAIQVTDSTTGQVVPYLLISLDILKDGRPVRYDQGLVPAVPQGESVERMHYTNNVAFPGKGRYQLFVRIQPSPLLGNGSPPSTQFEVIIE